MSRKFGLLGFPLQHSFSRGYHNERFARWGLDAVYDNYELSDLSQLRSIVERDKELEGLNVTFSLPCQPGLISRVVLSMEMLSSLINSSTTWTLHLAIALP